MRTTLVLACIGLLGFCSCGPSPDKDSRIVHKPENSVRPANTYQPGLGEFMSGIQLHHAKLWFAGQYQNWPLAKFEVDEIRESVEAIKTYCSNRPETKLVPMIDSPLAQLGRAIGERDPVQFKKGYVLLTNTCNSCHQSTDHAFNVITIPTTPPFSNQDYRPVH